MSRMIFSRFEGRDKLQVPLRRISAGAALAARAATAREVGLLRKLFGAFLIVVGLMELFGGTKKGLQ